MFPVATRVSNRRAVGGCALAFGIGGADGGARGLRVGIGQCFLRGLLIKGCFGGLHIGNGCGERLAIILRIDGEKRLAHFHHPDCRAPEWWR